MAEAEIAGRTGEIECAARLVDGAVVRGRGALLPT